MIRLEDVSLRLPDGRIILSDIDWRIAPEENWVLFGRNGSGKTRLLEIIAGYRFPSSGAVSRFGELAGHCDIRELRKRIGYVSTVLREKFSPSERIIDVVASGIFASVGLYEEVGREQYDSARELLASSGLSGREEDSFGILSDGERQKVIMLRAIIRRPDLLILDEPTKGLDLAAREEFLATLESMNRLHSASIIYVTHHVEEIIPVFSRILMLENGAISFSGMVKEGISSGRLTELFQRRVDVEERSGRYYTFLQ
jgi:iron complex transport system ATP-binding protein